MLLKDILMSDITPNPLQPRELFDKDKIIELSQSIETQGLIQPIIVCRRKDKFLIIAGERRWRAFSHLKKETIPAIIIKNGKDVDVAEKSLVENWQREDLSSTERENMIWQIKEMSGYSSKKIGTQLGISQSQIDRYIQAKKDRDKFTPTGVISTRDLTHTRGLDDKSRKWLLNKLEKGEMSKHAPEETVKILKKVPEKVKQAIMAEKIDVKDVEHLVDTPISETMENPLIEELTKRKKSRESEKKVQDEMDRMVLEGKLKPKPKLIQSLDTQRKDKLQKIRDMLFYTPQTLLKNIANPEVQAEAIQLVKNIRDIAIIMLTKVDVISIPEAIDIEGDEE